MVPVLARKGIKHIASVDVDVDENGMVLFDKRRALWCIVCTCVGMLGLRRGLRLLLRRLLQPLPLTA